MARSELSTARIISIACAIAATYLATSMGTAVSLILPRIASEFHLTGSQVQWILTGYLLARVGMLSPSGALCDVYGTRRVFILGIGIFSVSTFFCAFLSNPDHLVIARMAQGASAALLSPSSLVLLRQSVSIEREAGAVSLWSMAGIAGVALSPVFGGLLMEVWDWEAVFLFSAIATALVGLIYAFFGFSSPVVKTSATRWPAIKKDLTRSVWLVALAFLFCQGNFKAAAVLAVLVAGFILFKNYRATAGTNVANAYWARLPIIAAGLFGFAAVASGLLWGAYFIQGDLRLSAMVYGLSCVPMAVTGIISCVVTNALLAAKRVATAITLASVIVAIVAVIAYFAEKTSSHTLAVVALAFVGLCFGLINGAVSAAMFDAYPKNESGDASSIAALSKQFGQLVGLTVVGAYRELSGALVGSDVMLFVFIAASAAVMMICAAFIARRKAQSHPRGMATPC